MVLVSWSLVTPYRALDAALVPITVNFTVDQKNDFIKSLTLVVDEKIPLQLLENLLFQPKLGMQALQPEYVLTNTHM